MPDTSSQDLQISPLCDALGAQIEGVDLRKALPKKTLIQVTEALHKHLLLLIRDQDLSPAHQIAFSAKFGPVQTHPPTDGRSLPGYPEILAIQSNPRKRVSLSDPHPAGQWLCDMSYSPQPQRYGVIHARAAVSGQSDFIFANLQRPYQSLSSGLRRFLTPLQATHHQPKDKDGATGTARRAKHPLILAHPQMGAKGLYVNPAYTKNLEHLSQEESRPLLDGLFQKIVAPDNTYRHRWRPGDVLVWDCHFTAHYVVPITAEMGAEELRQTTVAHSP
ncbi:MAG: TauD/TfdA family dioxygenase [Pseudomonadota bacterium]